MDKGLLREVKAVQRILDALIQCRVSHTAHLMHNMDVRERS